MKLKTIILLLLLFATITGHLLFANQTNVHEQNQSPIASVISNKDTIVLGDSIIVIHTVCAPICSSCAHVYNKDGEKIGTIEPPFHSAFPEAYIENNHVMWRDNDPYDYTPVP